MNENEIAKIVVNSAFHIHKKTGPGLLESVYEVILAQELKKQGLIVERQKAIPIVFEGYKFDEGFRADIVVNDILIVELKSVETIAPVHKKTTPDLSQINRQKIGTAYQFRSLSDQRRHFQNRERTGGMNDDSTPHFLSFVFYLCVFAPLRETNSAGNDPSRKRCQVAGRAKTSRFAHSHTVSPSQLRPPEMAGVGEDLGCFEPRMDTNGCRGTYF